MTVKIYLNGRLIGSVIADNAVFDGERPPEASFRGFEYILPANYRTTKFFHIAFKSDLDKELVGSPIVIQLRATNVPGNPFPDTFSVDELKVSFIDVSTKVIPTSGAQKGTVYYSIEPSSLVESRYLFGTSHPYIGQNRAHQAYRPYLPYAMSMKEVFVDLDQGAIFLADGRIWQSSTTLRNANKAAKARRQIIQGDVDGEVNETVALLKTKMAKNYWHWHMDCMAGWHGVTQLVGKPVTTISPALTEIQLASFNLLAGAQPLEKSGIQFCREILVGAAFDVRGIFPARHVAAMFQTIASAASPDSVGLGPLVFISRKDTTHRVLGNEDELFDGLSKFGFQRKETSKLDYQEQIQVFREAECIGSTHGAGLTNLGFGHAGCQVFEILPTSYVNSCFRFLSALQDMAHFWFVTPDDPFVVPVDNFMSYFEVHFRDPARTRK